MRLLRMYGDWVVRKEADILQNARNQKLVLLLSTIMMSVLSELRVVRSNTQARTVLKSVCNLSYHHPIYIFNY